METLKVKVGGLLKVCISGRETILKRVRGRYVHERDRATCPVCKQVGFPWGGMFHCDYDFNGTPDGKIHKAIIETGQCFEVVR